MHCSETGLFVAINLNLTFALQVNLAGGVADTSQEGLK